MTTEQLTLIKRRQHSQQRAEGWFEIFRILFPDEPLPSNPYTETLELAAVSAFCTFAQGILPQLLADKFRQSMFSDSLTDVQYTWLQQEIGKNVAEVFEHLVREYGQRPSSKSMDTR
jgi:hypothetical protein